MAPRIIETAEKLLSAGPFKFFATQSFQYEIEDSYGSMLHQQSGSELTR